MQIIILPTRITGSLATLLDHIADDVYDLGIILSDISDHFSIFYIRHFEDKSAKVNPIKTFQKFDDPSILRFKTILKNEN